MPIASLTKAFTSAAISELVGEGKMDWDTTPVSTYLPEFAFGDPVLTSQLTLVDLLSHRTVCPLFFFLAPFCYLFLYLFCSRVKENGLL